MKLLSRSLQITRLPGPHKVGHQLRNMGLALAMFSALLLPSQALAGIYAAADSRIDTYQLLQERLGGNSLEVPDCGHSEAGPHITQIHDPELGEDVFAFHLHAEFDNDRCLLYDRQRTEITTYQSKALEDDVFIFQWRFKLDENYTPSTFWNHIFQLRPIDSVPGGNPVFTMSLLSSETEELLFYNDAGNGMDLLHRTPLAPFKGRWIDVRVRAGISLSGFIEVQMKSTLDGAVLLDWRRDDINLWLSKDTRFVLPKWGNYRSLKGEGPLYDETVLFNEFCVVKDGGSCEVLKQVHAIQTGAPYEISLGPISPFPRSEPLFENTILRFLQRAFQVEDKDLSSRNAAPDTNTTDRSSPRLPDLLRELWRKQHSDGTSNIEQQTTSVTELQRAAAEQK